MGACRLSLSLSIWMGSSLRSSLVPTRMIGVPGAIKVVRWLSEVIGQDLPHSDVESLGTT
jgi:hypothetical protein